MILKATDFYLSLFVSFLADIGKKQYFCGENMKKTCR